MDPHLQRLYRENTGPVAFLDESYRADGATTYYIVATALVAPDYLSETRELLRNYYGGETMHVANRPFGERQSTYPIAGFWISDSGAGVGVIC